MLFRLPLRLGFPKGLGMNLISDELLRQFVSSPPLRVVIDLNETCNLRCTYCHVDAIFAPNADHARTLPIEIFRQIISEVEEMQVLELTLTGGEITIMSNLEAYLESLTTLNHVSAQVITNGTTLTPKTIGRYKDANLSRLSISLDGFQESNDVQRGTGSFDRALKGIRVAVAAGIPVNVISVLSRRNWRDWEPFTRFLRDEGVSSQNMTLLCRLGRAEQAAEWEGLDQTQVGHLLSSVAALSPDLESEVFSVSLNSGALSPGQWDGHPIAIHHLQDVVPCTESVIKVNGDVVTNRLVGKRGTIGNVFEKSLHAIWRESESARLDTALEIVHSPGENADDYYKLSALAPRGLSMRNPRPFGNHSDSQRFRRLSDQFSLAFQRSSFTTELLVTS